MITSMEKRRKLETVRYTIKSEKLPRKMRPLKLVMLADLHDRLWGEHQRFLADKIEKLQGDLVLCAGDMLIAEKYAAMDHAVQLFEELKKRKFGIPVPEAFHILLAHNPVYFDTYAAWGADLTLSGHLHGGIIRIPGIGGLITPQAQLFPKYDRGLISVNGKYMVVSAGLGEHTVPIRIFNPPQLILITVEGNA